MKSKIIGFVIAATILAACNNSGNQATDTKQSDVKSDTAIVTHQPAIGDTTNTQSSTTVSAELFPAKEIIAGYLQLKNALSKDNGKEAAAAGNAIFATLTTINKSSMSADQQKKFSDLQDDIKEHAEHIGANAGRIAHQREHFIMLSKDMADFVKSFGNGGQILYKDFCPMADNGKGAIWISETKEIKNPYLGKAMPSCGTVKEEIK